MRSFALLAAALLTSISIPTYAAEEAAWRLFVSDHADAQVSAIDLESGEEIGSFELDGVASLYTTTSRAAVFAVQGDANTVTAIGTGIELDDHGDHGDISITEPELIAGAIEGNRPVHFVEHDGQIAIFFDGDGVAQIVNEQDWLEGQPVAERFSAAAPHHGVAVQLGDFLMVSEPNPLDPTELPIGMQVYDKGGAKVGNLHECPDLHGEASSGDILAIACRTGLLIVKQASAGPDVRFLPYSKDLPVGKSTTLLGGVGMQYFLGNYGADKLALIDPSVDQPYRLVDLPTRRVHFAVNPENVKFAYIFTEDGRLRELNVLSAELTRSVQVTEPYSMDGEWSLPRPRIAFASGKIAVTDPLKGTIHIVSAESLEVERKITVDGTPFNIVAVGGSGRIH
ncbi:MAG TPA: hypothetical protein VIL30_26325 [Ramlibacter sp.]|jgi:hypothetical protein